MKEILGLMGTAVLMGGFAPYILALWRKTAKPHAFSWLLWGIVNAIVCAAQISEGAGPGAWTSGMAAFLNFCIGFYALRHGERDIAPADWLISGVALMAIPIWFAMKDPLWSVVLVSVIDTLAFLPTIRKSWLRPHEEVAATFVCGFAGFGLSLAAVDTYNFTNICFQSKVLVVNALFIGMLMYRRRMKTVVCAAA